MPVERKVMAQQVLDELFVEGLLPFRLSAYEVSYIGAEEYIVRFHDSRLHSVDVSCDRGDQFKDVFRVAILERVHRMKERSA
jgi:hypothetical protein